MERARFCLDVVIEAFEFVGEAPDFFGIDDCLSHRISGEAGEKCGVNERGREDGVVGLFGVREVECRAIFFKRQCLPLAGLEGGSDYFGLWGGRLTPKRLAIFAMKGRCSGGESDCHWASLWASVWFLLGGD